MESRLLQEIESRRQKCREIASERGFHALLIIGRGPDRTGDLQYLANHSPGCMGHPRRYAFRGRSHSFMLLPIVGEPVMLVSTPFYEPDIAIDDIVAHLNN